MQGSFGSCAGLFWVRCRALLRKMQGSFGSYTLWVRYKMQGSFGSYAATHIMSDDTSNSFGSCAGLFWVRCRALLGHMKGSFEWYLYRPCRKQCTNAYLAQCCVGLFWDMCRALLGYAQGSFGMCVGLFWVTCVHSRCRKQCTNAYLAQCCIGLFWDMCRALLGHT